MKVLIKLGDKAVSVYEGEYKPVTILKNAKEMPLYTSVILKGDNLDLDGTYNDVIKLYGNEYLDDSENSLPPTPDNPKRILISNGEIKTYGKNMLNLKSILGKSVTLYGGTLTCNHDGGIIGSGIPTSATGFQSITFSNFKKDEKVVLSAKGNFSNIALALYLKDGDGNNLHIVTVSRPNQSYVIDISKYPTAQSFEFQIKRSANNVEMWGTAYFQLEYGSVATEYCPYFENSSISDITLAALEVDENSDYNYTEIEDEVTRYYLCDIMNGNKITNYIGSLSCTGEEEWILDSEKSSEENTVFSLKIDNAKAVNKALCSHFALCEEITEDTPSGSFLNSKSGENNFSFVISKTIASNLEEWKNWLATQNELGVPLTISYILTEPMYQYIFKVGDIAERKNMNKTFPLHTKVFIFPAENCCSYKAVEYKKLLKWE